jgi:prevent-host-death family protein
MVYVGIREFKNNLSQYVRKVKRGEMFIVTERGKPVARLMGQEAVLSDKDKILNLIAQEGLVDLPRGNIDFTSKPVAASGKLASLWILENRR